MPRSPQRWTPEEDRILLEKAKELSSDSKKTDTTISWTSVSSSLANRNNKDCRKRWCKLMGAKKGLWTLSEDERLLEGVQKYGSQWVLVAKIVKTRNSDQCAKRWQHCLDPSLDHSEWTNEKDAQLIAAVKRYGTNWKDIKNFEFPMRSTTNLKNRHIALSRQNNKKPSVAEALSPNIEWLSIEQEMYDSMMIDGSEDDDYIENDDDESPHTLISSSPIQNNRSLECDLRDSSAADTIPTSTNSGQFCFPMEWDLLSHSGPIQSENLNIPLFENFHESIFNQSTDVESTVCRDIDSFKPYIQELPTLPTSLLPLQQTDLINNLQNLGGTRSGEVLIPESNQSPQGVANNVQPSMPQMTLTIDNPDLRTMTNILEVLTKAKNHWVKEIPKCRKKSY